MKKYLTGIVAVILAIGFSAFTREGKPARKLPTNYVWFNVKPNAPNQVMLTNADVTYNSALSAAPATNPSGCPIIESFNCIVGFNSSQVTGTSLNSGSQTVQATFYRRHNP